MNDLTAQQDAAMTLPAQLVKTEIGGHRRGTGGTCQDFPVTEVNDVFLRGLQAIFIDEARDHLARLDACLGALGTAGAPPQVALLARIRDTLHTFKGAARSVGLEDLEFLCLALENVFAAAMRSGAAWTPAQLGRIGAAIGLAGLLLEAPAGRIRNQAQALSGQLDALARELAAGAVPTAHAGT